MYCHRHLRRLVCLVKGHEQHIAATSVLWNQSQLHMFSSVQLVIPNDLLQKFCKRSAVARGSLRMLSDMPGTRPPRMYDRGHASGSFWQTSIQEAMTHPLHLPFWAAQGFWNWPRHQLRNQMPNGQQYLTVRTHTNLRDRRLCR